MVPGPDGRLQEALPARFDEDRSRPNRDAVVLTVDGVSAQELPWLYSLDPTVYAGGLRVIGITHLMPERLDAELSAATRLEVDVPLPGPWGTPPKRYDIPAAFRLAAPTDARPGISGAVVFCEGGIVGLIHFARAASSEFEREAFVVPWSAWAEEWPSFASLIQPLIDRPLQNAATIKPAMDLAAGIDVTIAGYNESIYVERVADGDARTALHEGGGAIIIGRPKSGKTRLAWELLREDPYHQIVIPHQDSPPPMFETAGLSGWPATIFFDDLHRSALSGHVSEWMRRLEDATRCPCRLLCTSRDGDDWQQLQRGPAAAILNQVAQVMVSSTPDGGLSPPFQVSVASSGVG